MSTVPTRPADQGVDPRQGDLLELLGLPPEKLEGSRHSRRSEQGSGGAEASRRPRPERTGRMAE